MGAEVKESERKRSKVSNWGTVVISGQVNSLLCLLMSNRREIKCKEEEGEREGNELTLSGKYYKVQEGEKEQKGREREGRRSP